MSDRETMGLKLLSCLGWDAPKTRGRRASDILKKIYRNTNGVALVGNAHDKALVDLFCSESTFAAANNLVETVGTVNVTIGNYRNVKEFKIPWEALPFAAMLVSLFFRVTMWFRFGFAHVMS